MSFTKVPLGPGSFPTPDGKGLPPPVLTESPPVPMDKAAMRRIALGLPPLP